ncbi:MAG: hypothetical protein FWF86_08165, partial [Clostridia bacterium]|nr:hypothetical protein [Clostridia bacterium]
MKQKEETFKAKVRESYFSRFAYRPSEIDFVVAEPRDDQRQYYWAEAKRKPTPVSEMLTQLILTCRKTYERGDILPPKFLGCFDDERIAFIEFNDLIDLFSASDVNWKATPSAVGAPDFAKLRKKVEERMAVSSTLVEFRFDDPGPIYDFIRANFNESA